MKVQVNGIPVEIKHNPIETTRGIPILRKDILKWLGRIGITREYISINYGRTLNGSWAEVAWDVNGKHYFYKSQTQDTPRDNLAAIEQLVHQEVLFIERKIKTFTQVMNQFALPGPKDIKTSFNPRQILGIPNTVGDPDYIRFRYRELVKKHHPDKGGDPKEFRKIQKAYDMLKIG